jgi:two-component system alkaline phosphatase synthesis response regulator PhoP/two-component system response regulator VicR
MAKKILAVDDERHIVRLVQINLVKEGYEVITASNGREALEKAKAEKPDLVVMDVMMPEMDGFEALEKMKADPETASIPVIMLTAKAQDADVFSGWQKGADLYLTKPFNPSELLTFVKRIFSSQVEAAPTYEVKEDDLFDISDIDPNLLQGR